jgi:hypothetical protein
LGRLLKGRAMDGRTMLFVAFAMTVLLLLGFWMA